MSATCPVHNIALEPVGYGVLACPNPKCSYGTTVNALEGQHDKAKREAQPIRQKVKVLEKETEGVTIELPMPPSSNNLFVNAWGNQRGRTQEYQAWAKAAGRKLDTYGLSPCTGLVRLKMTIHGGKGFPISSDLSNRWKAIEDLLVTHGILKDDNVQYVVGHTDDYVPPTEKGQQAICLLTIEEISE